MKFRFLPCLLILACGWAYSDQELLAHLLKARYALAIKAYDRALDLADDAQTADPYSSDAAILRIEIMLESLKNRGAGESDFESALMDDLETGITRFPRDHRFFMVLGRILSASQRWKRFPRFDDPEIYLKQAVRLMRADPKTPLGDFVDTQYQLGLWYFAKDEAFLAAKALKAVCDVDPTMSWAFYYAGQACERSGQFNSALSWFEKYQAMGLREFDSTRLPLRLSTAILRALLNPEPEHLQLLFAAINDEGLDQKLLYDVALRLFRMDNLSASANILEQQQIGQDLSEESLQLYLRIQMERHQYEQVLVLAKGRLAKKPLPRMSQILVEYGAEAALLANRTEALKQFVNDYGAVPQLRFRLSLFNAFSDVLMTGDTQAWHQFIANGLNKDYTEFLKREAAIKGIQVVVVENVAQVFLTRRDWQGANQFLQSQAGKENPVYPLWDELADSYALVNKTDLAFQWYKKILEKEPQRPDILNNYGYFLTNQNRDLDRALTMIQRAVDLAPGTSAYLDSLGWVHFRMGNLMKAEHFLLESLKLEPDDPEKLDHYGDIQWALGSKQRAREAWSRALELAQEQVFFLGRKKILDMVNKLDPITPQSEMGKP